MLTQINYYSNAMNSSMNLESIVKQKIEEVTGNALSDIHPDADLVEDLGISSGEMLKIVKKIEFALEIELTTAARSEVLDAVTVRDLVEIIEEEYEY